jgi:hypothetical protein
MAVDGLSNLKYDVIKIDERPLYTYIIVYFPGPKTKAEVQTNPPND